MFELNITAISDTHGRHMEIDLGEPGDVIIHSGDCTRTGSNIDIENFLY